MEKIVLLISSLFLFCVRQSFAQLERIEDFGNNPGNLKMYVHLPTTLDASKKIPLVIALHGCYQTAEQLSKQSGWSDLANRYGFIIIYPEQQLRNNGSRCFNWFKSDDIDPNSGEAASIKSMVEFAKQNFPIDESNTHVYGVSAGGAMTTALLVQFPCIFQAGAVLAGGPFKSIDKPSEALKSMRKPVNRSPEEWGNRAGTPLKCTPTLIVLHGKKDQVVSIKNSFELIDQWSAIHKIDPVPSKIESGFNGNQQVSRSSFVNKNEEEVIVFYEVENLRHQLPIDPGNEENQGGKTSTLSKDVDFFSTYFIAKDFGIVR